MRIACRFKKILPSHFWAGRVEQSARAAESRQRAAGKTLSSRAQVLAAGSA
jgi:hypothetical protein